MALGCRAFLIALASICALAPASAASQAELTQQAFRDRVAEELRSQRPGACVELVGETELRIGPSPADCSVRVFTDNAYQQVTAGGLDPAEFIPTWATRVWDASSGERPTISANDAVRIVVQLRPVDMLQGVVPQSEQDQAIVSRPFAGDLMAILMLDSPTTLASIPPAQLVEMGLTPERAFELALSNTRSRMGSVSTDRIRGITVTWADSALATGLLVLPESCTTRTEGTIAYLTDRYSFMTAAGTDARAAGLLRSFAKDTVESGQWFSRTILICLDGQWRDEAEVLR